jgi:cytochrome c peroxidase
MINNDLFPLGQQLVATDDSELGALSCDISDACAGASRASTSHGLTTTYLDMIKDAFHSDLISTTAVFNGFSQTEANFSFFWGVSVMLYGATLIPDQTPFDLAAAAGDGGPYLTQQEQDGFEVFEGKGRCDSCHRAPEFTNAAITNGGNGNAFVNTGVRPIADDGGQQPHNRGEFKVPTLRNVEFTGPYFHNGGKLTLRQVVDFYDRGGDHPNDETDSDIRDLDLTETEKVNLVHFLLALTDPRVECEMEPFDHPSIIVPQSGGPDFDIPAVGAGGGGCLTPFLGASPFMP